MSLYTVPVRLVNIDCPAVPVRLAAMLPYDVFTNLPYVISMLPVDARRLTSAGCGCYTMVVGLNVDKTSLFYSALR